MSMVTGLETIDLTPHIGSELKIDKAALLGGDHAAEIRTLLAKRGALVVRGAHLSDEELRTVARTLGDLRIGGQKRASDGKVLSEGDGGVLKVSLDPEVNPEYARFLPGNFLWHMDGTYEEVPPFATLFMPYRLSREGGDTMFASTYAAFEDLPAEEQTWLEKLRAVHTMSAALFPSMRQCTPEEFAAYLKTDIAKWGKLIKQKSIRE